MSGFKALNVDSETEDEVDDTKEIQTEEAFKIYQNALRLHSQGPSYYDEARTAYDELFQSELFKYPEALSEFAHELLDQAPLSTSLPTEIEPITALPSNAAESAANSIPHLVYLAHKNRGQFAMDEARHGYQQTASQDLTKEYYAQACSLGLRDFAEGLERDDTDIDLWKKAARVAEILKTPRIARFCLESVLAGDDDDAQAIDLSGLDEAFASGELKDVLRLLQDDLSQLRVAGVHPKPLLLALLRKSNDSYPFLPRRPAKPVANINGQRLGHFHVPTIPLTSNTVFGLGNEIHHLVMRHQEGDQTISAHSLVRVSHPQNAPSPADGEQDEFVDAAEDIAKSPAASKELNDIAMTDSSEQLAPLTAVSTTDIPAQPDIDVSPEVEDHPKHTELPSRKRSSTVAGNDEPEGRLKSRRLRARESILEAVPPEEDQPAEPLSHLSWNRTVLENADSDMLKTTDSFLSRLDLELYGSGKDLWEEASKPSKERDEFHEPDHVRRLLAIDLCNALQSWTDDHSQAFLHGHGSQDIIGKTAGLTLFQQHLKVSQDVEMTGDLAQDVDDLPRLTELLSRSNTTLYDALFTWLFAILTPRRQQGKLIPSSYLRETWPADTKQLVVQLLIRTEEYLLSTLVHLHRRLAAAKSPKSYDSTTISRLTEMVLTIFELHIDIHSRITNPSSQVAHVTRIEQTDRLERWAGLTDDYVRLYTQAHPGADPMDDLTARFLWATTTYAGKAEDIERAFIMTSLQDLQHLLEDLQFHQIALPNNAAIPLISAAAAEQELFRLSTLDFFMSVFDTENDDSVAVIEKLEPIMEADISTEQAFATESDEGRLIQFLSSGDASLRLFLWRRLQNAYTTISYTPKVVSCMFRAFETIVKEIQSLLTTSSEEHSRQITLLKWFKDADDLLAKILSKVASEPKALEAMDEQHLRSSLKALTFLVKAVHVHALYEDQIRFGSAAPPYLKGAASTKLYEKSKDRFREMHVHLWCTQYFLLKEATEQYAELFPDAANDLADYLCTTHHALGQRHYCRYGNKQLVRLVRAELIALPTTNNYFGDMAQVMFDLYQLRFKVSEGDHEHGCSPETLDKKTAISLIPMVMAYAKQITIKDLLKNDLRHTIEEVQKASGVVKSGPIVLQNRKLIGSYLKSQLIPEHFYKAYKGQGGLVTNPIEDDDSVKAKHGWYFLLGHITLAKFRAVKRVSPTPTDDLDTAATLLRQDLEHNLEQWETWWRLAQIYEAKIEDDLIWNSAKLNDFRSDIAALERHSIHCFLMATTIAMRVTDENEDTPQKVQDMFQEFAIRLYASSRPPLSMVAFKTDKTIRHLSNVYDQHMSKTPLRAPWTSRQLWKFAAALLQKRFVNKPKPWTSHYYRHKCLWKILQDPSNRVADRPVRAQDIIDSITEAIAALPRNQKSTDIILEPHVRLVSVLYKLVRNMFITPQQGHQALQSSKYAVGIPLVEDEDGPEWERYLLNVLKRLSSADKANWQHRIINRAAHIIYDAEPSVASALGAKHEFTQQIFTKTMTYQVWKPERERAGRHYIFTGKYVTFFAHLLDQLQDRTNLDQLVRRVRRKYHDFIDHTAVWEHLATTYVRLLRRIGKIPEGQERALFDNTSFEEFSRLSDKLEAWALDSGTSSIVLDIMREAIDLKKLNNSLLKGGIIDDVIGDAYACLYDAYVSQLTDEERKPPAAASSASYFINATPATILPNGETSPEHGPGIGSIDMPGETSTHQFVSLHHEASSSTAPPRAVPPNKPGRTKTITRREVQRKAEAAIAKPPPIKTPTLSKRPVVEIPINGRRGSGSGIMSRVSSAATSRRNSVQDSLDNDDGEAGNDADDESDNEEDEDQEQDGNLRRVKRPLFPGSLLRSVGIDGAGSDADDDDDLSRDQRDDDEDNAEEADFNEGDDVGDYAENADEHEDVEAEDIEMHAAEDNDDRDSELEIPESQNAHTFIHTNGNGRAVSVANASD